MALIPIGNAFVNTDHIRMAMIEPRNYMNGTETWLVLELSNGSRVSAQHGSGGFDAFKTMETLERIQQP